MENLRVAKRVSEFGQFDVVGFPKGTAYWYASQWLAAVPETSFDRAPVGPANQCHLELWKSAHKANVYTNGDCELFNTTDLRGTLRFHKDWALCKMVAGVFQARLS